VTDVVERAFRRHYGTVYRYVRRRSRSHEQAEDLTQEVFAAAAAALPSEDVGDPPVLACLYTVAQRRFADEVRRRGHEEVDSMNGRGIRGQAVELAYGAGGFGPGRRDSVVRTQIREDDPARSYIDAASTTPRGFADLDSGMTGSDQNRFRSWTASLRHSGLLVQIQGRDRELVLRAARALRPIPAGAH